MDTIYFYMVDGIPFGDENASELGEEDVNLFPIIRKTFETGAIQTEISDSEEYGALLTTYISLRSSSGELIGIVGADLDATHIYASMESHKKKVVLTTLIILLVSIIIVYLFTYYLVRLFKRFNK